MKSRSLMKSLSLFLVMLMSIQLIDNAFAEQDKKKGTGNSFQETLFYCGPELPITVRNRNGDSVKSIIKREFQSSFPNWIQSLTGTDLGPIVYSRPFVLSYEFRREGGHVVVADGKPLVAKVKGFGSTELSNTVQLKTTGNMSFGRKYFDNNSRGFLSAFLRDEVVLLFYGRHVAESMPVFNLRLCYKVSSKGYIAPLADLTMIEVLRRHFALRDIEGVDTIAFSELISSTLPLGEIHPDISFRPQSCGEALAPLSGREGWFDDFDLRGLDLNEED